LAAKYLFVQRNSDDRQEFANQVNVRMLRALDSHANFVMVNPMRSVEMVVQHLKKKQCSGRSCNSRYGRLHAHFPKHFGGYAGILARLGPNASYGQNGHVAKIVGRTTTQQNRIIVDVLRPNMDTSLDPRGRTRAIFLAFLKRTGD
jgi:hypothetical protein